MARVERETMLMQMAEVVAERGTCSRLKVGAVFARDGRVITMGYNGAPQGMPHCVHDEFKWDGKTAFADLPDWIRKMLDDPLRQIDDFTFRRSRFYRTNTGVTVTSRDLPIPGCDYAEHAERNGIAFAARYGVALEGADLYCTHMPCLNCARMLLNAGITAVFYKTPYRLTAGVELLRAGGVSVIDINDFVR